MEHLHGRRQSMEDETSSTNPSPSIPSQVDQEASSEARNIPVETSRPVEPSKSGRFKARTTRGRSQGKRAREESGDAVPGGEDVA